MANMVMLSKGDVWVVQVGANEEGSLNSIIKKQDYHLYTGFRIVIIRVVRPRIA